MDKSKNNKPNKKLVTFKIPATSANIGSGFDSVGLALDLYNEIHIYSNEDSKKIEFEISGEGENEISKDNNMILDAFCSNHWRTSYCKLYSWKQTFY